MRFEFLTPLKKPMLVFSAEMPCGLVGGYQCRRNILPSVSGLK
jgi:hypothetical protein